MGTFGSFPWRSLVYSEYNYSKMFAFSKATKRIVPPYLTNFRPIVPFYTPWKQRGFLFSGGIEGRTALIFVGRNVDFVSLSQNYTEQLRSFLKTRFGTLNIILCRRASEALKLFLLVSNLYYANILYSSSH